MAYFTLDATAGGASANSYIGTVADIRSIASTLAAMPSLGLDFTALNAASDSVVTDAAVLAAQAVDTQAFPGYKKTAAQARAWPRVGVRLPGAENTVPEGIRFAQVAEIAALLSAPSEAQASAQAGVAAWTAGKKSVTYDPATLKLQRNSTVSPGTKRVLDLFKLTAGSVSSVYIPRG